MENSKVICICGSMVLIDAMEALAADLRNMGHKVHTPVREESSVDWGDSQGDQVFELKRTYIDDHLETIKRSDLVLVANYRKNGIQGYIGTNSLMEAAFAYALNIPVVYLEEVGPQPCKLEALAISTHVLTSDLESLRAIL